MRIKSLFRMLIAPIVWLIQACSPLGKPVNPEISDSHFYNNAKTDIIYSSMGNWFELGKNPLNADAESFKVFNRQIGKDKYFAYYQSFKVEYDGLDLASFHAKTDDWMWHLGLDNNNVYLFEKDIIDSQYHLITKVVEKADPATFQQVDADWGKDKQTHFYRYRPLEVDYGSFQLLNNYFAFDKDSAYFHFQGRFESFQADRASFEKVDDIYAKDGDNLYMFLGYLRKEEVGKLIALPYTDFSKVKVIDENHLRIDDKVYYKAQWIRDIVANEAQPLDSYYIKDQTNVFYLGQIIEGAHAPTFRYDKNSYSYKDKNNKYREGKVWNDEKGVIESSLYNAHKTDDDMDDQEQNSFRVELSLTKETYLKNEAITIHMKVANISDEKDQFCDYHTPFEGIQNNIFTIYRGKKEVEYQGKMKKRIPPTDKDYIKLKPGKSTKCSVELDGYDLSKKGSYTIQFTGNMISGLPGSNVVSFEIK